MDQAEVDQAEVDQAREEAEVDQAIACIAARTTKPDTTLYCINRQRVHRSISVTRKLLRISHRAMSMYREPPDLTRVRSGGS